MLVLTLFSLKNRKRLFGVDLRIITIRTEQKAGWSAMARENSKKSENVVGLNSSMAGLYTTICSSVNDWM